MTIQSVYADSSAKRDASKRVKFDFGSHFVTVTGLYTMESSSKKNALQAEIEARNTAVSNIKNYISESCESSTKSFKENVEVSQNLREVFRSHGSTIYPNTQLKILLKAPISKVFTYKNLSKKDGLQDSQSNHFVFRFPNNIPGDAVICGAVKFRLEKEYYIVPNYVSIKGSSQKVKVIDLYFDRKEGLIKVKFPEDLKNLLEKDIPYVLEKEERSGLLYLPAL